MKSIDGRIAWGLLLVAAGVLFLLENLGVFEVSGLFFAVLLGAAGVVFLAMVIANRSNWWAVIPGLILVYLGAMIALDSLITNFSGIYGGAAFLAVIGLSFWIVYFMNRSYWWAVIPGGVMVTLALVAGLSELVPGDYLGGTFFLGLGLTFGLVAILPTPGGRMHWALIPGGILFLMGIIITAVSTRFANLVWPVALILAGLYLFFARSSSKS